jgi:hypothetical protein
MALLMVPLIKQVTVTGELATVTLFSVKVEPVAPVTITPLLLHW